MKTLIANNYRNGIEKPRLPHVRLTRSRRRRRAAGPEAGAAPILSDALVSAPEPAGQVPAPVAEETAALSLPAPRAAEAGLTDSLQLYLREIGRVKLPTHDEQMALARRVQRGDKQAREQMITANLRLVVKIAREYEGLGLPLLDLINEGNIGLMKAVQRFDPNAGARFSTYSAFWIKQSIRRALSNHGKTIRLPVHVIDKLTRIRGAEVKLRELFDREPTDDEVAEEIGLDARRVRLYRDASRAPVALDAPISSEDATTISEHVADANAAAPFAELQTRTDNELVQAVLGTLDPRESRILSMRFGLDDGRPKTLEEVGASLGVTRERIRQLQEQALEKMRFTMDKREQNA
jgi:RNA polymerase primary sigma factor